MNATPYTNELPGAAQPAPVLDGNCVPTLRASVLALIAAKHAGGDVGGLGIVQAPGYRQTATDGNAAVPWGVVFHVRKQQGGKQ